MKKFWNRESVQIMWLLIGCCFLGIAAGAIFANIAYPYRGSEAQVLGIYVIERLKDRDISSETYLLYLMENRLRVFLLLMLAGMTGVARGTAVCAAAGMGFLAGAVGSMTVLAYGMRGLGIFLAANLPQTLLYAPSILYLLTGIYQLGGRIFRKQGMVIREYLLMVFLSGLGCLLGVLFECYANPVLLEKIFG